VRWLAVVLVVAGCNGQESIAPRQPSGLDVNPPTVALCSATPCWCEEPATAYERVGSCCSNFPSGYAGSGSRTVVVVTDTTGVVEAWPGTPCGEHMANNPDCPCIEGRYVETEMLARTLAVWPDSNGVATFALRPGLDYYARQAGVTRYIAAGVDTVRITPPD
jgi:hypothetical protein